MGFANKEIAEFFFKETSTKKTSFFCNRCNETFKQNTHKGNVNLRQFSEVKHMFPQSRKSTLPKNIEAQVFLKTNDLFWGVRDVDAII